MRCARFGIHNITYCVDIVIIDYCKTGSGNSSILMCVFAVLDTELLILHVEVCLVSHQNKWYRADVILEYDNHSGSHNDVLTGYYQSCPVSCHE